jgi:phage terminase large subunit GpA-like protein
MPNWPLKKLAEQWVDCMDSPAQRLVFFNKLLGEPYDETIKEIEADEWRHVIVAPRRSDDAEAYMSGQFPPAVSFLTAGQDSVGDELHYTIWGWGLRRTSGNYTVLCGWLIDWGKIAVAAPTLRVERLHVFDELIYARAFPGTGGRAPLAVRQGGHDTGYRPVTIGEYCRAWPNRAIPIKGRAAKSTSRVPPIAWGAAAAFGQNGEIVRDESQRLLMLNTFSLKTELFAMLRDRVEIPDGAGKRIVSRLALPHNAADDDELITQLSNEELVSIRKVRYGEDEKIWKKKGPNHYLDCTVYAYAIAQNLNPYEQGLPFEEAEDKARAEENAYGVVGKAW